MAGPFISCSSHQILQLGQRVVPLDVQAREDNELSAWPSNKKRRLPGQDAAEHDIDTTPEEEPRPPKPSKGGGGPHLKDMIAVGILQPGHDIVSVTYKGMKYAASLMEDGSIIFQGKRFNSPSAFSVHVKRLQTPNKQGDDGWKSAYIEGLALDEYRQRYKRMNGSTTQQRPASQQSQYSQEQQAHVHTAARPPKQTARKKAAQHQPVEVAPQQFIPQPVLETAHWVQCNCCDTWRVVPDEHWPAVQADEREEWFCEDAWWDVALLEPYTAACKAR